MRQVDLVDHRDDRQILLHRQVDVGHGLGLDALGGVDDQQRPFARAQAARDFIGEIHVARRVDQVQLVGLPVLRLVKHVVRSAVSWRRQGGKSALRAGSIFSMFWRSVG